MKKIIICAIKSLLATILTMLSITAFITFGIWLFSLGLIYVFLVSFGVITFITFFQAFYGTLDYGIMEKYRKYIDGDDDV